MGDGKEGRWKTGKMENNMKNNGKDGRWKRRKMENREDGKRMKKRQDGKGDGKRRKMENKEGKENLIVNFQVRDFDGVFRFPVHQVLEYLQFFPLIIEHDE